MTQFSVTEVTRPRGRVTRRADYPEPLDRRGGTGLEGLDRPRGLILELEFLLEEEFPPRGGNVQNCQV